MTLDAAARSPLRFGVIAAVVACALDQASKLYLLFVYDLPNRAPLRLGPLFDFVLTRNRGISYGLFQTQGPLGQWLLLGFKVAAVIALAVWLTRARDRLTALSLGLIIGGAIGNAIDRIAYGAVADFFSLHAFGYQWYVFNIADMAIVAGVVGLLYDSLVRGHKKVGNPSKM